MDDLDKMDNRFRQGYEFAQRELAHESQALREATAREMTKQLNRVPVQSAQGWALSGALAFLAEIHE